VALDMWLSRVSRVFGARLRVDEEACRLASMDASGVEGVCAGAVLYARDTHDVVCALKEAASCGVAVVPRGAGTGKSGGCVPVQEGSVVLDVSRMCAVHEMALDDGYVVVEPGLTTYGLDAYVREQGYFYPPDPASWESCTLGGNIATNAGGPRAVKYGVTGRYVWGVDVVLMGGECVRFGRTSIKGVSGLPLSSLWVGSEGTLGVITRAVMHVLPSPGGVSTAWIGCASMPQAHALCMRILKQPVMPRMLEVLDEEALDAVCDVLPVDVRGSGRVGVLLEVEGLDGEKALENMVWLCEKAGVSDACVARNSREAEVLRDARRRVSSALKQRYPMKWSDDIAVPRSAMAWYVEALREQASALQLPVSTYGHWGDGNIHVNVLCKNTEERIRGDVLRESVVRLALSVGGTLSGEHGVGLSKRKFVALEHSPSFLYWQNALKKMWDPQGLMNPGKSYVGLEKDLGDAGKSACEEV
jgi:glycolate oxidase